MSKIKIGFSPYTYARIAVMKSQLFKKNDYDRLLKMGYNEALRFLQDTHYRQEIDDFDVSTKGAAVIDAALNTNLLQTVRKLHRISGVNMQKFIETYALRYDIENLKMIIRSTYAGIAAQEVEKMLLPSLNYSPDILKGLLGKEKISEILDALPFSLQQDKKHPLNTEELYDVENAFDRYYIKTVYAFAQRLSGEGKIVGRFLMQEIDTVNIRTVLRLIAEGFDHAEIIKYLIKPSKLVLKLAKKKDVKEIVAVLQKEKRTTLSEDDDDLLVKLEIDLDAALLKKESTLMHKDMLSAQYILGFLFAKEIEVKNVRTLIKCKQLDIAESHMAKLLVIPG
jgi:V/A-type H+/Na+-transporting ATPase subunit C